MMICLGNFSNDTLNMLNSLPQSNMGLNWKLFCLFTITHKYILISGLSFRTWVTLLLPSITLCWSNYPKYKSWTFFPFWDQPSSPLHHHIIAALLLVFIICGWETLFKFFLLWVYLNDKVSLPHVVTQWHRYHNDDVGSWEVAYLKNTMF